ncbi:MAG: DHH family phosphoesterase [Chloroflexi bacterium]|nr:DHH family phosphoesterase [Chloroflexota bacterium]
MPQLSLPVDFSAQRKSAGERRMQQLRTLLGDRRNTLVLMHNDPDPDAIAAGYALQRLIRHLLPAASVTLGHGGMIGRAENRTMAQLLVPHALRIPTFEAATALAAYDAILLVDTQLSAGNHLLYEIDYPQEQVILAVDHHPPRRSQIRAVIHDVRPEVGATATLLAEYVASAEMEIDDRLATALFYGVKSDTRGLSRHTTDLDIWAYSALRNYVDTELLNQIEHVQLPRSYFRGISDALMSTMLYRCADSKRADRKAKEDDDQNETNGGGQPCTGYISVSLLFQMQRPDMASEVADLMLRMEDVSWAICLGIFEDRLVISVRADRANAQAGRIVRAIVGKNGTAGGHDTMAGGRIHAPNASPAQRIAELHALVPRFLQMLGAGEAAGMPLLDTIGP